MEKGVDALEKEIAAEKAAALGRSGRKLRAALDKLRRFDETDQQARRKRDLSAREKLVEAAGEALWAYVVQREAIGLIDAEYIRKEYAIPPDVWQHMNPQEESGSDAGPPSASS